MKIVNLTGNSQVTIEERPRPQAGPGEVVVKTVVSAICGSEMHDYRKGGYFPGGSVTGGASAGGLTGNMGHEAAGIVVEIGEGVQTPGIGHRVGVSAIAGCGHCAYCTKGQYTWCANYKFYDSMHAEYFTIAALACHPLPDDVPWEVGVLITGDGMGVPYHTSTKINRDDVRTIAVFGLGPIGLGNVLFQTYLGRQVIGIDRSPERLDLARRLGAVHTVTVKEGIDVPATIRELTEGHGADVCIEAAGVAATAKQCFEAVRIAGTVVFNGEQKAVELSPSEDFIRRDITAVGSWFYHFSEYPSMLAMYRSGLQVDSLITHRFSIEQASQAYEAMQGGLTGKILLEYEQE